VPHHNQLIGISTTKKTSGEGGGGRPAVKLSSECGGEERGRDKDKHILKVRQKHVNKKERGELKDEVMLEGAWPVSLVACENLEKWTVGAERDYLGEVLPEASEHKAAIRSFVTKGGREREV